MSPKTDNPPLRATRIVPLEPCKVCPRCGENKVVSDFYRCVSRKDGRYFICRTCCETYQPLRKARIKYRGKLVTVIQSAPPGPTPAIV